MPAPLTVTGRTTDGRLVVRFFPFVDTHGLPMDVVLDRLRNEGMVPDWTGFYEAAVDAGWHAERTLARMEAAVEDVFGAGYLAAWRTKMDAWRMQWAG